MQDKKSMGIFAFIGSVLYSAQSLVLNTIAAAETTVSVIHDGASTAKVHSSAMLNEAQAQADADLKQLKEELAS